MNCPNRKWTKCNHPIACMVSHRCSMQVREVAEARQQYLTDLQAQHDAQCGPLCEAHGDPRDTSIAPRLQHRDGWRKA